MAIPIGLDADMASGCTILPRPAPYTAEHPLVQFAKKAPIEDIAPAGIGPAQGSADIDLLGTYLYERFNPTKIQIYGPDHADAANPQPQMGHGQGSLLTHANGHSLARPLN